MPKISHTPLDFTLLPLRSRSPNAATAARRALSFDQMLLPRPSNITQSSAVPTNTYAVNPNHQFQAPWEQHIHYNALPAPYVTTPTDSSPASSQSSELQLALPALPPPNAASTPALEPRAANQSTFAANMVIPSKEIASPAPIIEIQDVKLPLKVITSVCPQTELFLNTANDNVLEEVPEDERPEEIEAEQPIHQAQPSPHQWPPRRLEVTELAEPIFLIAQEMISISPHCQQWVRSTVFPTTTATIPDVILQPLAANNGAAELPVETAVVNITNGHCPLLFINNTPNSIKL
uniref:Uncharacterized protein n=1 Tax=Romanomermis culicivorax TaxID=13658 RepID=A0A915I5P9_ROMCU